MNGITENRLWNLKNLSLDLLQPTVETVPRQVNSSAQEMMRSPKVVLVFDDQLESANLERRTTLILSRVPYIALETLDEWW